MTATPPSLIKWTGSKRSQAAAIAAFFPRKRDVGYFEPFLGGGAVAYLAAQTFTRVSASDLYAPLIDLWGNVKLHPEDVINQYKDDWGKLQSDFPGYFFEVRDRFNKNPNGQDLLFLSRTCVNGIIRFNKKGEFNNSIHLSRRGMKPAIFGKIVTRWNSVLGNTTFSTHDYSEILEDVGRGDFVYLDPPYFNSHNRYVQDLDIEKFLVFLDALNRKGARWALSFDGSRGDENLTYELPRELYRYHTKLTSGNSAVQKVLNDAVQKVDESLYLNYQPESTSAEQLNLDL